MPLPSVKYLMKQFLKHPLYYSHLLYRKYAFHRRFAWVDKTGGRRDGSVPPPLVYKLILTWKCNLRCKMCMLWGKAGWRNDPPGKVTEELEWGIIEKIVASSRSLRTSFILSGGEPMLYSHFIDLVKLLKKKKCFSTICTNGTLIDNFTDYIAGNQYLAPLISLDGLEEENDLLRGKGTYRRVINNIRMVKKLKNAPYIGMEFTLMPENVRVMYDFCKEMVRVGVDWIVFNLGWFITPEEGKSYEETLVNNFNVFPKTHKGYLFPYFINKEEFLNQYKMILNEKWPIQISCQLKRPEDIEAYINSSNFCYGGGLCYKQWTRLDVVPNGQASPCVQFPDLLFGNLLNKDIDSVWNSMENKKFRRFIRKKPMFICKKCDALYLYDAKRKYL